MTQKISDTLAITVTVTVSQPKQPKTSWSVREVVNTILIVLSVVSYFAVCLLKPLRTNIFVFIDSTAVFSALSPPTVSRLVLLKNERQGTEETRKTLFSNQSHPIANGKNQTCLAPTYYIFQCSFLFTIKTILFSRTGDWARDAKTFPDQIPVIQSSTAKQSFVERTQGHILHFTGRGMKVKSRTREAKRERESASDSRVFSTEFRTLPQSGFWSLRLHSLMMEVHQEHFSEVLISSSEQSYGWKHDILDGYVPSLRTVWVVSQNNAKLGWNETRG